MELKFRAWDKEYNRMFSHEELYKATNGIILAANANPMVKAFDQVIPIGIYLPTGDSNMTFMQHTGIKDFYEGDILKDFNGEIYVVVWFEGAFYASLDNNVLMGFVSEYQDLEVIGNIYENLELMEG